jgi:hypothetical protein
MVIAARNDRKRPPQKNQKSPHQAELSAAAGILLALLTRRARGWPELAQAGFRPENFMAAVTELERAGHEISVGPELVEFQEPARAAS